MCNNTVPLKSRGVSICMTLTVMIACTHLSLPMRAILGKCSSNEKMRTSEQYAEGNILHQGASLPLWYISHSALAQLRPLSPSYIGPPRLEQGCWLSPLSGYAVFSTSVILRDRRLGCTPCTARLSAMSTPITWSHTLRWRTALRAQSTCTPRAGICTPAGDIRQ